MAIVWGRIACNNIAFQTLDFSFCLRQNYEEMNDVDIESSQKKDKFCNHACSEMSKLWFLVLAPIMHANSIYP